MAKTTATTGATTCGLMEVLAVHIVGEMPLIVHNGQLADPLNPFTKALKVATGVRKKTDADHAEVARLEFMGSLYIGGDPPVPVIPGYFVEGALKGAAAKHKLKKDVAGGVYCMGDFPLIYPGPKDPDEMWKDGRFRFTRRVKLGRVAIMRTRAIFMPWEVKIEVSFYKDLIDRENVVKVLNTCQSTGFGEWCPKYGRFRIESIK